MPQEESSNKRIAKNTLMLYIRMLISMLVGLYTSRVVLQTLGVEDYGIYGVVGGVVSMMGFLNASMSGATSRFITFELGKGDMQRVRDTFSSAMIIHIGIALVVIFLAETVGLWFLCNKLVIPEGRMEAAHWVYQCSIISAAVGITQSPYTAVIMSREKMDIYAYMELLNVFLKLGIVYLLVIGDFDKLILYAILTLVVSVLMAMLYRLYCLRHYEESHFAWVWKKEIIRSITSFSLYNILGNFGAVFNLQGVNFTINMFFGVVFNASASIAGTVSGIVQGFVSNIITVFRPSLIKAYAQTDIPSFERLLKVALFVSCVFNTVLIIPLLVELDHVLQLWLGLVPDYAATFCRIILISVYFETFRYIFIIGVHAVGKVQKVSIATGFLYIINPIAVYLCFRCGMEPKVAYIGNVIINIILIIWVAYLLHVYIPSLNVCGILINMIIPIGISLLTLFIVYFCTLVLVSSNLRILLIIMITLFLESIGVYFFGLDKSQRKYSYNKIKEIINR